MISTDRKVSKDLIYDQIGRLLTIGIALSTEKDHNRLLEMIVSEARRFTNCDAGTLYLKQGEQLEFKIIQNQSLNIFLGGSGEKINLPAVPLKEENISAYVAISGKSVNISDVYDCEDFDFSGPRNYDNITGYHTQSMLVIPMENHEGEIIGVLQLINSLKEDNETIRDFPEYFQRLVESLASQASIAITNVNLMKDIENLFNSFIEVMATAIDSRTPYNANHTRRVALLARATALAVNQSSTGTWAQEFFNDQRLEQITMAGWLHDIGKIGTPLSVMNKETRLDRKLDLVLQRIDYIYQSEIAASSQRQVALLKEGKAQDAEKEEQFLIEKLNKIQSIKELIVKCNHQATIIDDDMRKQLHETAEYNYIDLSGRERPYIEPGELEQLCVCRGTLTESERGIIEDHVVITARMLEKISFIKKYKEVPRFAAMHHEFLDGKGYPLGVAGQDIPLEVRILTLVDVYDALTARDRPYKKAMSPEDALRIIGFMVEEGKLDAELYDIFKKHCVWTKIDQE